MEKKVLCAMIVTFNLYTLQDIKDLDKLLEEWRNRNKIEVIKIEN